MMAASGIQASLAGLVLGYPPRPGLPLCALSALSLPMTVVTHQPHPYPYGVSGLGTP